MRSDFSLNTPVEGFCFKMACFGRVRVYFRLHSCTSSRGLLVTTDQLTENARGVGHPPPLPPKKKTLLKVRWRYFVAASEPTPCTYVVQFLWGCVEYEVK